MEEAEHSNSYLLFKDVLGNYKNYIMKMLWNGIYWEETYTHYVSYCRNMQNYNNSLAIPIFYIYQFDRDFCMYFLVEVYMGRDNNAFIRDNYYAFLQTFLKYYLKNNPTDGISSLGSHSKKKIFTF